jgi:hypothetical protein
MSVNSLLMNASRPCWICDDPADTDEHRRKRSDIVARYGASWTPEQQPFVIRGDGSSRWTRIQGPNDRRNLYERMLCNACNSTRTKPFDQAYQQFSEWVLASAPTLHERDAIDFADIFGEAYREKTLDLLRYFAKSLGCRIVHADIEPLTMLRQILTDASRTDTKPLVVTFEISESWRRVDPTGRTIGDDCFDSWPEITDRPCFSWFQMLGYLQIFYLAGCEFQAPQKCLRLIKVYTISFIP